MSYTSTGRSGATTLHKITGGVIVLQSLIGMLGLLMIASYLGTALTLFLLFFALLQIGIAVGLIVGVYWASLAGKIYYGFSALISLVAGNVIGAVVSGIVLAMIIIGDQ